MKIKNIVYEEEDKGKPIDVNIRELHKEIAKVFPKVGFITYTKQKLKIQHRNKLNEKDKKELNKVINNAILHGS